MQDIKNFQIKWATCFENVKFKHYPQISRTKMKYPTIYSWQVFENKKLKSIYIGETVDIGRRFYHYKNPGVSQKTNKRIKQELTEKEKSGFIINFCELDFDGLKFNNSLCISKDGFENKSNRLIIENLVILHYRNQAIEILNNGIK